MSARAELLCAVAGLLLVGPPLAFSEPPERRDDGAAAVAPEPPLAALGRQLFFDPALSASGKLACASCHDPRYAYGPPPGKAIAFGGPRMDQMGTRAVPSLRYLGNAPRFAEKMHFVDGDVAPGGGLTWDGRATSLHEQAQVPLLAANEMANRDAADVVGKIRRSKYAVAFRVQFGEKIFNDANTAFADALAALEAFERLPGEFSPYSSRYDAFLRGDVDLTDQEEDGVALFKDPNKGNCASCHTIVTRNGVPPTFTDYDFMNAGVPRNRALTVNRDSTYFDRGLMGPARNDLAGKPQYCGFFRAPSLRNVALRDAFFHNGALHSLSEVLQFYVSRDLQPERWYPRNADGKVQQFDDLPPDCPNVIDRDPPLDREPGATPALNEAEMDAIVAFLRTLTDGYQVPLAATR